MTLASPDNIVSFVAFFEGFRSGPYLDAAGHLSIGYGFRYVDGEPVTASTRPMTGPEARALLREQLDTTERLIQSDVGPGPGTLDPWKWDALTSLVYNIGHSAWLQSTMLQMVRAGNLDGAAAEFPKWCHVNGVAVHGLVMRRYWERHLWEYGYRAVEFLIDGIEHWRSPKQGGPGVPHPPDAT